MRLISAFLPCSLLSLMVAVSACGAGSDYQGGGRRADLGSHDASGVGLAASGEGNTPGVGGTSGAVAAGSGGDAGDPECGAGGENGNGLAASCSP
jgi:hypothetical protein